MFNYLFQRYKVEVRPKRLIKDLELFDKFLLFFIISFGVTFIVYSVLKTRVSFVITCILFSIFIIMFYYREHSPKKKQIIENRVKPYVNETMENMLSLLKDFDVNIESKEELDCLIVLAQKEKELYDSFKPIKQAFYGLCKFFLSPSLAAFLAVYFDKNNVDSIFANAIYVLFVFLVIFIIFFLFSMINKLVNYDERDLDNLISDIEDIKAFQHFALSKMNK